MKTFNTNKTLWIMKVKDDGKCWRLLKLIKLFSNNNVKAIRERMSVNKAIIPFH